MNHYTIWEDSGLAVYKCNGVEYTVSDSWGKCPGCEDIIMLKWDVRIITKKSRKTSKKIGHSK